MHIDFGCLSPYTLWSFTPHIPANERKKRCFSSLVCASMENRPTKNLNGCRLLVEQQSKAQLQTV